MIMCVIQNGGADILTNDVTIEDYEARQSTPDLQVLTYPSTRVNWVTVNTSHLNIDARRGLSFAFPDEEVLNGVYKGLLIRSEQIPDTVISYDPDVFIYQSDLEQAKQQHTSDTDGVTNGHPSI
jgi:hypothetical protein